MLLSDVCLFDVCRVRRPTSVQSREQRGLGRPTLAQRYVAHVTRDSDTTFKVLTLVKGQVHQAALPTAALTREAGAVVTVRTYWAWETTAVASARRRVRRCGAHGGGEGRGHIVSPRAQLVVEVVYASLFVCRYVEYRTQPPLE